MDGVFYSLYINVPSPSYQEKLLLTSLLENW